MVLVLFRTVSDIYIVAFRHLSDNKKTKLYAYIGGYIYPHSRLSTFDLRLDFDDSKLLDFDQHNKKPFKRRHDDDDDDDDDRSFQNETKRAPTRTLLSLYIIIEKKKKKKKKKKHYESDVE